MTITLHLQPSIGRYRAEMEFLVKDLDKRIFSLASEIDLDYLKLDGEKVSYDLLSKKKGNLKEYQLPLGVTKVRLSYDHTLEKKKGVHLLRTENHFYPTFKDKSILFEVHTPKHLFVMSNYPLVDNHRGEDNIYYFKGKGSVLFAINQNVKKSTRSGDYYLLEDERFDLLEKPMTSCFLELQQDFGKLLREYRHHYVMAEEDLSRYSKEGLLFFTREHLKSMDKGLQLVRERIDKDYDFETFSDFSHLKEALKDYLWWRSLKAIKSDSERMNMLHSDRVRNKPLAEEVEDKVFGLQFFYELEEALPGEFDYLMQSFFEHYLEDKVSLVHFYNHFGEKTQAKAILDKYLFDVA